MPTVFITGASRGLGEEFVKQFLEDDWDIIATCRNPNEIQLDIPPNNIDIFPLDVTVHDRIKRVKSDLGKRLIDVLINNAGITGQRDGF